MMLLYFMAVLLMRSGKLFRGDCCGSLVMAMALRARWIEKHQNPAREELSIEQVNIAMIKAKRKIADIHL